MSRSLLLHVCCAPCLTVTAPALAREGWSVSCLFYNPNIHPLMERNRRLDALRSYIPSTGLDLTVDEAYPLEENLAMLLSSRPRCAACYADRLGRTAALAAGRGSPGFSTTLMLSPYVDHDLLRETGEAVSRREGVEFVYHDLRGMYAGSVALSRQAGLYRQSYCGCVMSERDRYAARLTEASGPVTDRADG